MMAGPEHTHRPTGRGRQQLALVVFFLLIVLLVVISPSTATSAGEPSVQRAELSQAGRSLILQVRTEREVNLSKLDRRPNFTAGNPRYLCLELNRLGRPGTTHICLGGKRKPHAAVGLIRTGPAGKAASSRVLRARVKKVDDVKLVVTIDPERAGLPAGMYSWRIADRSDRCRIGGARVDDGAEECVTHYPPKHLARYELRPIRVVGCTGGNGDVVRSGPGRGKKVALTFDDGPSEYTPQILDVLKRTHAQATFFMLGQQVAAYPSYARRVLAQGHEVANHSYDHALLPSAANIRHASRAIEEATHFTPCLFRPPYGAMSGSLQQAVESAHMKSVIWDVDTSDWKLPGAASIQSEVVHASHAGSIVLMHDGGGPRGGTVDALEGAIRGLRHRGFELVTVTELLGNRFIYRPAPPR